MPPALPEGFVLDKTPAAALSGGAGASAAPPAGFVMDKPEDAKFDGVDVMTQTLYDMAKTPTERKRALEHGYGSGNVKEDARGLYIEKDGKRMKPSASSFGTKAGAFLLSETAPTIGGVAGSIGGAMIGNVPGAFLGAGAGTAAGQGFNDTMLKLAGVYDRSVGEEAKELALAGGFGMAGEGAGRLVGKAVGNVVEAVGNARSLARWAIGVDEAEMKQALELANAGVHVPMESYAPNSPMIGLVRTWAKKYGHDPVAKSATTYYENKASNVLSQLGVPEQEIGKLTKPTSATSYEKTGEALIKRAKEKLAQEDIEFDKAVSAMRSKNSTGMVEAEGTHKAEMDALVKAESDARSSASKIIDHGWEEINATQDKMWAAAKLGEEPGNLAREYAGRVWDLRKAVSRRARLMYDAADAAAGRRGIDATSLVTTAKEFLNQLPEELGKTYPAIVRTLSELDGRALSFGEARNLRTELRDIANYEDLTSNFKNGIYKKLAGELNAVIHNPMNKPQIKDAAKLLDEADNFYSTNLAKFKDQKVISLTKLVRAGLPPNPSEIAKVVLHGGNAERATEMRKLVGPAVWDATVAADIKGMLKESESLIPGQVEFADFWRLVQDRMRSGVLESYPENVKKLILDQARRLGTDMGKYKVPRLPDDDFKSFLTRADEIKEQIKKLAEISPIDTLKSELQAMEKEFAGKRAAQESERAADQLKFLHEPTLGATEAAKRIIKSPDKLKAALLRFDADGNEIQMLRQTAARDILSMSLEDGGGKQLSKRLQEEGMTEEVQKRLFPNGLDKDVLKLAEDMRFLFKEEGDLGASFSAVSQVTNPLSGVPGPIKRAVVGVPLFVIRALREKTIGQIAELMTSPKTVKWLSKGLNGTPEERAAVKKAILEMAQTGGDIGSGIGAFLGQMATAPSDPADHSQSANGPSWRDRYQQRYAR